MTGYERCPRSLAGRAMAYMQSTGIADDILFGPEPEFFVFDSVTWNDDMAGASYRIRSEEADWSKGIELEDGNMGHRPGVKGGYFPVPPVDSIADLRGAMCLAMEEMGLTVEVHHHEVATAGQCEIGTRFASLIRKADEIQILKYCVHNVAHAYGKTATFMPKPLVGDNGSGMHCHQSLSKGGKNFFGGNKYAGLSQEALWYIGGNLQGMRAPSTRSRTRAPTATSVWSRGSRRRPCSRTRDAIAPHRCGSRTAAPRPAASRCGSPIRAATRT